LTSGRDPDATSDSEPRHWRPSVMFGGVRAAERNILFRTQGTTGRLLKVPRRTSKHGDGH